jgi:hypothetical protein
MSASVQETVRGIIAAFERGDIPEAIAYSMFPIPNVNESSSSQQVIRTQTSKLVTGELWNL